MITSELHDQLRQLMNEAVKAERASHPAYRPGGAASDRFQEPTNARPCHRQTSAGRKPYGYFAVDRPLLAEFTSHRWFTCRYCSTNYVGGSIYHEDVRVEENACFAHEAYCPQRPARLPISKVEQYAVDRVLGQPLRDDITDLDTWADELRPGSTALSGQAELLDQIAERRAQLVAELRALGLAESSP